MAEHEYLHPRTARECARRECATRASARADAYDRLRANIGPVRCPRGGGAEGRSLSEELNVAPLLPPGADDGACAAVGATQSITDVYPANDAPATTLRNTTGTSCFLFSLVCRVIETPPSRCPAPSANSGTSTSYPVLLASVVGSGVWCPFMWWLLRATASVHFRRGVMRGCRGTPFVHAAASKKSISQLLETFPLPGGGCIPYSEMIAIGRAYDVKIAKAESGLSEARGAFRNATGLIRTIRKKRALVQYWTVHNAGEGESELEKLLGEWATCCDRITNAIFTTKGTVLFPAHVH